MFATRRILSRYPTQLAKKNQGLSICYRALSSGTTHWNDSHPTKTFPLFASALLLFGALTCSDQFADSSSKLDASVLLGDEEAEETTEVINWSGTHQVSVSNKNLWEPETVEEVQAIVRECHAKGQIVRPLGSSLSPNGIALNKEGMISMVNLDKILNMFQ